MESRNLAHLTDIDAEFVDIEVRLFSANLASDCKIAACKSLQQVEISGGGARPPLQKHDSSPQGEPSSDHS